MSTLDGSVRRAIFYLFYDRDGQVDDYVLHKLGSLRHAAEHIFVISNGALDGASRTRLESVADTVWERENVGFDVWGYKEAHDKFGWDRLAEFDELLLINYTFFGPVYPFDEVFARMGERDVDFWGLTEHGAFTDEAGHKHPAHIQSHWIAVRNRMLRSTEYREYWQTMPEIRSYDDSIVNHEARFTRHFAGRGFSCEVAWPAVDYPTDHPVFDSITQMLDDRLPIVKRRLFFHDPLYLDRNAIIGRDVVDHLKAAGFPLELVWRNVVRSAPPRVLGANTQSMSILPDEDRGLDREQMPTIAVIAHLYYDDMVDEILDRVDMLPGTPRVVITTASDEKKLRIDERLRARGFDGLSEVRVVESNRGRDISAFYVTCRDVLQNPGIDLIVKIHGKRSVQDGYNAGNWFKRHLVENLIASRGYAANVVKLFQDDPTIGIVFPPVVHTGYPTLGHGWFDNRGPAKKLAAELGIRVPLDADTPLAPLGSMFIARREALQTLTDAGFSYEDFPEEGQYRDGALSHVVERIVAYAAAQRGFRTQTVMNSSMAEISHTMLEHKLQAVSQFLPGYAIEQVAYLQSGLGSSPLGTAKSILRRRAPALARVAAPAYRAIRRGYRRIRGAGA
ncbi:MAG: rhamnan synthesis F family protein [Pseudoclavibacter sp.]